MHPRFGRISNPLYSVFGDADEQIAVAPKSAFPDYMHPHLVTSQGNSQFTSALDSELFLYFAILNIADVITRG